MSQHDDGQVVVNPETGKPYRANFLFGHNDDSVEFAGYEFANGGTEAYQQMWWRILQERSRATADALLRETHAWMAGNHFSNDMYDRITAYLEAQS